MSNSEQVAAALDPKSLADLDKLAAEWACTREHIATTALLRFLSEETRHWPTPFDQIPPPDDDEPTAVALSAAEDAYHEALEAFVQVGEDAIERGELYTHEEVMAFLRARYGSRKNAA